MPTAPQPLRARKPRWPAVPPRPAPVIDYPDWGVEPMTPIHRQAMKDVLEPLESRYDDRTDVCVGSDMTMYYREGDNERAVMPDVFVAFGPSRDRERDVWKVWEEGKLADFVLEVASKSTHVRDLVEKHAIYESLGVAEYWQHDPTGRFLPATLIGHRLVAGAYEPVPLETMLDGKLCGESKALALRLCLDERRLRLFDPTTGEFLPTNVDKDRIIVEERHGSAAKDRIIEAKDRQIDDKDRIIEELRRRLADR